MATGEALAGSATWEGPGLTDSSPQNLLVPRLQILQERGSRM